MEPQNKLRTITQEEFDEIYRKHQQWLKDSTQGERADLSKVDFTFLKLPIRANLTEAKLREARLWGANLWRANLWRAELWRAELRGIDLREADLKETELWGANLINANLMRADLTAANLVGVDLRWADLTAANLWGADLRGANLWEANLLGADLRTATISTKELKAVRNLTEAKLDNRLANKLGIVAGSDLASPSSRDEESLEKIRRLEQEVEQRQKELAILASRSEENAKKLIEEKNTEIEKLKSKLDEEVAQKKQRGETIEGNLKIAFTSLDSANSGVKTEIERIEKLYAKFRRYIGWLATLLLLVWITAFVERFCLHTNFTLSGLLLYTSPSLLLAGFLYACVVEINKLQRHLISLRSVALRYSEIQIGLEGYYAVSNELEKNPEKAQEVFNAIVQRAIVSEISFEQAKIKPEKVDRDEPLIQEKVLEKLSEISTFIEKLSPR